MSLKLWHLELTLFLIVAISGVVSGADVSEVSSGFKIPNYPSPSSLDTSSEIRAAPYTGPVISQPKPGTIYISEKQKNIEEQTKKVVDALFKVALIYAGDETGTKTFSTNGMIPGQKTVGDLFVDTFFYRVPETLDKWTEDWRDLNSKKYTDFDYQASLYSATSKVLENKLTSGSSSPRDKDPSTSKKVNQLSGSKFPQNWQTPSSKKSSGLESWGSHPKGWGVSAAYVQAHPEIYGPYRPPDSTPTPSPSSGAPTSNDQSNPNGLTPEQLQAIQDAIDNMQPLGEYNHYESTNPHFQQNCGSSPCPD